jgi:hypothetical protein
MTQHEITAPWETEAGRHASWLLARPRALWARELGKRRVIEVIESDVNRAGGPRKRRLEIHLGLHPELTVREARELSAALVEAAEAMERAGRPAPRPCEPTS